MVYSFITMENQSGQIVKTNQAEMLDRVLVSGDLSKLTPEHRVVFYNETCKSLGLNPLTKPFEYIKLNGKEVLYARRDCTDQLRSLRTVSVKITSRDKVNDVYVVTAQATLPSGRCDESIGAVSIVGLKGDALANALMKAETKAKRRVTLSICGLGMLDESEVETIPASSIAERPNYSAIPDNSRPPASAVSERPSIGIGSQDYVMPVGINKGKRLSDISIEALSNFAKGMSAIDDLTAVQSEALTTVREYLKTIPPQTQVDYGDEVPF